MSEGGVDDTVVVLCKDRLFAMHGTDGYGRVLGAPELQAHLQAIVDTCKGGSSMTYVCLRFIVTHTHTQVLEIYHLLLGCAW